jgi:hypothetical protein
MEVIMSQNDDRFNTALEGVLQRFPRTLARLAASETEVAMNRIEHMNDEREDRRRHRARDKDGRFNSSFLAAFERELDALVKAKADPRCSDVTDCSGTPGWSPSPEWLSSRFDQLLKAPHLRNEDFGRDPGFDAREGLDTNWRCIFTVFMALERSGHRHD